MFGGKQFPIKNLSECCIINPYTDVKNVDEEVSYVPMSNVGEHGELILDTKSALELNKGYTKFIENDVLFAKITPCMENGKGAIAKGLLNNFGIGSTEFHVLRPLENISNSYWIYYLTSKKEFRSRAEQSMTGASGHRRVPESFISNYPVNLPPKELQDEFASYVEEIDKLKFALYRKNTPQKTRHG
ncbi:MAG: restriction endonuclease subunit S [Negativicoccus succinicivorans]|uniref:restriction endonuclease subunit S n=1 Tax=Negativicoccus succinicivorans TaxID=620903 RepID=UPI0029063FA0|nr:restriction endonuclease subunit S [Negativicoccus succinicivorans]MDU5395253.1 restriction endonuclease subunit S [Negativicoccus succinicivorans]